MARQPVIYGFMPGYLLTASPYYNDAILLKPWSYLDSYFLGILLAFLFIELQNINRRSDEDSQVDPADLSLATMQQINNLNSYLTTSSLSVVFFAILAFFSYVINLGSFAFVSEMAGYDEDGLMKVPIPDETYDVAPYMYFLSRFCTVVMHTSLMLILFS